MYALVISGEVQSVGTLPKAARDLANGAWVMPPNKEWTEEQAAACGYLPVVETPRPPDTDTITHDWEVQLLSGVPTQVWVERLWTDEELDDQQTAALRTDFDVAQAQLTPDQTNALLSAHAPPDGAPWAQPSGAHDAYPLGAIVTHDGKTWESLITANVHAPGVSGWLETGTDWPAWVQPAGGHDAYQVGAQVSHPDGGQHWISIAPDNVWEPGVYGWDPA